MTNLDITQKTLTTSIYHSAQKVGVAADNEPTALGLVMTGVNQGLDCKGVPSVAPHPRLAGGFRDPNYLFKKIDFIFFKNKFKYSEG